ncbi:CDPK adapter, putative (DUF1423) isoform X3 [Carex rostrata]
MFISYVYLKSGTDPIGEVEVYPKDANSISSQREFKISYFTTFHNKQCSPLGALQTVGLGCLCFKMVCKDEAAKLVSIYTTCLREKQTAVIQEEHDDIHLVAMKSPKNSTTGATTRACFWGFKVSRSLFSTCLAMLKQRRLGIVFGLDDTLIVANTSCTFKDQINSLKHKISCESDPFRASGMKSQIERYRQDLLILEQYAEDDQVVDNGNIYKVQSEVVPSLQGHLSRTRPVIRLLDRGIILTRINPSKRDTSVLVKIRPGWEEIRIYLTPTWDHQRSFDVYACTMAEHELAMEMWRLLDPQFELIASSQLHSQIMCLKANSCRSLQDIFHYRQCHPKMSLVIDNRVDVWDEKDQSRVHVVPTFSPYSTTQEEANAFPLPDVKNVASNVSQGFLRDFDGVFLPRIDEVLYEDEFTDLPSGPDVGDYLMSKDASISLVEENNGSKDINLSQYCGNRSNLELVPVSTGSSGKGLPYAPENWPKKGDVWTWRVGQRVARSGHHMDRYLYPPEQYTKGRLVLSSRLSVEEFVKKEFPGVDVDSFFASFNWKIPGKGRGCTGLGKSPGIKPIAEPEPEPEPEPRPESPIPEGLCKARNKTCNLRKEQQEQSEIKSESEPFSCDICCSEPGFCRECCCILCSKTVDWKQSSHTFIRCLATVNGSCICGHGAHIKCALQCFMAGTVGGSIGLDAEYYCRRCDNKMDLVPHVAGFFRDCQSAGSRKEAESVLNLGLCALSGTKRAAGRKLHGHINSALSKIKNGASLDEIFKEDGMSSIDSAKTLHEEDHRKRESSLDSNCQYVLPCKRKGYADDNTTTRPSKKQENPFVSFNSPLEAEKEVSRVLLELRRSQEEYKIVEKKLLSQKDHLFGLYKVIKSERDDLADPIVRQLNSAETYSALVSRVNARAEEVKKEEEKLQIMLKNVEKFVQTHKVLKEHFAVDGSGPL